MAPPLRGFSSVYRRIFGGDFIFVHPIRNRISTPMGRWVDKRRGSNYRGINMSPYPPLRLLGLPTGLGGGGGGVGPHQHSDRESQLSELKKLHRTAPSQRRPTAQIVAKSQMSPEESGEGPGNAFDEHTRRFKGQHLVFLKTTTHWKKICTSPSNATSTKGMSMHMNIFDVQVSIHAMFKWLEIETSYFFPCSQLSQFYRQITLKILFCFLYSTISIFMNHSGKLPSPTAPTKLVFFLHCNFVCPECWHSYLCSPNHP